MTNEILDRTLSGKAVHHRFARTQRELLKLLWEERYFFARWNFKDYIKLIFSPDDAVGPAEYEFDFFHDIMISELFNFLFSDEVNKLMFLLPPRTGKSEMSSILIPSWICGIMGYRFTIGKRAVPYNIIQSSYSDKLLKKFLLKIIDYTSKEKWKKIFPSIRLAPKGGRYGAQFRQSSDNLDFIADVKSETFNDSGGEYRKCCSIWSVPVGGAVTGHGGNLIILDDMVKGIAEAESSRIRETTWKWWLSTLSTRLEDREGMLGKILAVNTLWHEDDLASRLINDGGWKVVRFPAYAYKEDSELRDKRDLRPPGAPLSKRLERQFKIRKGELSRDYFSALYQQSPAPEGGFIIKKEDLRFYDSLPKSVEYKVMSIDLAFKGAKQDVEEAAKQERSFCVFEIWGLDLREEKYYLIDQRRGLYAYTEQKSILRGFLDLWPQLNYVYLEEAATATALVEDMQKEILNLELVKPKESKTLRLRLVEHLYQQHRVFYPQEEQAPWVSRNIEELIKFPKHKYKDTVDVASQALFKLKEIVQRDKALDTLSQY